MTRRADSRSLVIFSSNAEANNFEDKDGKPLNFMNNEGFVGDKDEGVNVLNIAVPVILGGVTIAGVVATLQAL